VKAGLEPGTTGEVTSMVGEAEAIHFLGPDVTPVLSTPSLIWYMEAAAREALAPFLDEGENSVGTMVHVAHLAPTPVGGRVTSRAKVVEVEGRRVVFEVEAFDETEKIGEGTHERFVVDEARFASRVNAKRQ
jgi:fluoroacetyl-CoA thioesterase